MISKAKRKRYLRYMLSFFILCLGVVIGIAIRHYYNLTLSETLNIIDVATLLTTVFIAVYVPSVLDKNQRINQEKKNLINERIDELQLLYSEINSTIQKPEIDEADKYKIDNSLDIISNRIDTVLILLSYLEADKLFTEEMREINTFREGYKELFARMDYTIVPTELRNKEEALYNQMDRSTSLLLFKLSDA